MSPRPQVKSATSSSPPQVPSPPRSSSSNAYINANEESRRDLNRRAPPMASLRPGAPAEPNPIILPPGANLPAGEYGAGRVICEVCGGAVSFRDEGGAFTLKHWEAHRLTCHPPQHPTPNSQSALAHSVAGPSSSSSSNPNASFGTVYAQNGPPVKRRRAKRTEEERIDYLRSDPQVAQFEAYRVLCANCNKWIRLRSNSTYCSIPWDAHRKSCFEKR
ncbi:hypothetical protein MVEN_01353700 [Mycena venus]|uniref:Uncharacterized protein n=1 Tax=Mycena venus TaxID=2733690 RepID=A0A8H6Y1W6_9AGAR|nr:hypothetical protein MVEN_01353700 [Mycena venus]